LQKGVWHFMYKICFYVPESHLEEVKNAMFAAGAGKIGNYSNCAWQVLGEGQFLALEGNQAYLGTEGHLEKVVEYKVEMVCEDRIIRNIILALKGAHPYEEPAYQVWKVEDQW
jgi:structural toxin protein (hemagglutinin/hemolysin) RtxA